MVPHFQVDLSEVIVDNFRFEGLKFVVLSASMAIFFGFINPAFSFSTCAFYLCVFDFPE